MASTKKSLLASGLSLVASAALLVGTTFAWFTDSVTNTGNVITAGNLSINAYAYELGEGGQSFTVNGINGGQSFTFEADANRQDLKKDPSAIIREDLWEPGQSSAKLLKVENGGSLAAKLQLEFKVTDGGLMDALWFDFIQVKDDGSIAGEFTKRPMSQLATIANSKEWVLKKDESVQFILVYGMDKEAGNVYQGKTFSADVTILATQATFEKDGFGNDQYDKDAEYKQVNVDYDSNLTAKQNGEALQAAIAGAPEGSTIYVGKGEYDLPRNPANVSEQPGWYFAITGNNLKIVGEEGAVLTSTESSSNGAWASQNLVTIFGDNVTLDGFTLKCKMDCNKAIEVIGKNSTIRNPGPTPITGTSTAISLQVRFTIPGTSAMPCLKTSILKRHGYPPQM